MVREKLLCRTRTKPPADVPPLSTFEQSAFKTTRQHYENAHARGFCQSCHIQFVQQNFHTSPYQDFDESDDYSFAPDFSEYRDHDKLTVYYDGQLVWGTPP